MKKRTNKLFATLAVVAITFGSQAQAQEKQSVPLGKAAPSENFTGKVWVHALGTDTDGHWSAAKVTFDPGAHSNWHSHKGKQVVVITEGTGYLKQKGQPLQQLRPGDVAEIEPGIVHWHGAAAKEKAVQVVTNTNIAGAVVDWMQPVTAQEYEAEMK